MKRLIILILAITPIISGCKKDDTKDFDTQVKEIAWNSLSEQEKATVIVEWEDAIVKETNYEEKSSYSVIFNTSYDALLGPITVYIDKTSLEVLGKGLRM